jgi:hypothetical protein
MSGRELSLPQALWDRILAVLESVADGRHAYSSANIAEANDLLLELERLDDKG